MASAFDFSLLRKSMETVGGQLRSIRAELEKLRREHEDIANAPAARSDVKRAIAEWASQNRAGYLNLLAHTMKPAIEKPSRLYHEGSVRVITATGGYNQAGQVSLNALGVDRALCALMGPALVESMCKLVDELPWPEEGLPLAQRTAKLDALMSRIKSLEQQEAEITQTARSYGVVLEA